jgi:hypothetical protein
VVRADDEEPAESSVDDEDELLLRSRDSTAEAIAEPAMAKSAPTILKPGPLAAACVRVSDSGISVTRHTTPGRASSGPHLSFWVTTAPGQVDRQRRYS